MSIKLIDTEKFRQEIEQELRQKIKQEIEEELKNEIAKAKLQANAEIRLTKVQIEEYQKIVNQTKKIIEIVKKHNIRNLANLAKSVETGRVIRELKRANKQLIYIQDIQEELLKMQTSVKNWQKIIKELDKYDKYKKQEI